MTKTPEQIAEEFVAHNRSYPYDPFNAQDRYMRNSYLAGYKAGFEIGCMKGSMAMQSTLDDDYHLTPIIDHEKLAEVMIKKETE